MIDIKIIREMYNDYMSPYKKKQLDEITDYSQVLKIHDYGTINGYATYNDINMPLCADKALDKMKKVTEKLAVAQSWRWGHVKSDC